MLSSSEKLSIYLHIPFCTTKCTYCAFNTYTNLEHLIDAFIDALCIEISDIGAVNPYPQVKTVYFGGGTPSLLSPTQFEKVLSVIHKNFDVEDHAEISLESNPNDLDIAYLQALRSLGINRISIGMQSANKDELNLFARRHDFEAVVKAVEASRLSGFQNVSLDLIYGFPYQTLESWQKSLGEVFHMNPEHISMYALGIEDGTPFQEWVASGRLPIPDDDLAADMYELASELMSRAGYEQYEISNWSKPDYQSQHNLQYWYNLPYIGLGPGAHGFANGIRYSTILSPQRYIKSMHNRQQNYDFPHTAATHEATVLTQSEEIAETLIMGLRLTQQGINRKQFIDRFGVDLLDLHRDTIQKYTQYDMLEVTPERIRITQLGRLLSNMIFRELV